VVQIVYAIKQSETGSPVNKVCRKMGISEATFYNARGQHAKGKNQDLFDRNWLILMRFFALVNSSVNKFP